MNDTTKLAFLVFGLAERGLVAVDRESVNDYINVNSAATMQRIAACLNGKVCR